MSSTDRIHVKPRPADAAPAKKAADALRRAVNRRKGRRAPVRVTSVDLPASVMEAFETILGEVAEGRSVVVESSVPDAPADELTTSEAAHLLGMSRPTLINLLEEGALGYRMVGSHRRIPREEVMAYREEMERGTDPARRRRERLRALRRMAEVSHEAGEGY